MRLYLMRHGETDWNTKGLIQGSTDVPLNENGRKLAEMTREGFLSEGIAFTRIFASPLVRAHETAKIVAGKDCSIQIETDDRILIQRDAAPNAVIVRRQQVLQKLIVGGEPLHPHVAMGGKVAHAVRHGNHQQVVLHDVIAVLVEHKAALARRTQHVHAGMAQLAGVCGVEIGGI